jgi:hypothetical protein
MASHLSLALSIPPRDVVDLTREEVTYQRSIAAAAASSSSATATPSSAREKQLLHQVAVLRAQLHHARAQVSAAAATAVVKKIF